MNALIVMLIVASLTINGQCRDWDSDSSYSDGKCSKFACNLEILERLIKCEAAKNELRKMISQVDERVRDLEMKSSIRAEFNVIVERIIDGDMTYVLNTSDARVPYDLAITNTGMRFDMTEKEFKAPCLGEYIFSATACASARDYGLQEITTNAGASTTVLAQIRVADETVRTCGSATVTTRLDKDDAVWVARGTQNPTASGIYATTFFNSFTGTLVKCY